jgi:hypothetical protein
MAFAPTSARRKGGIMTGRLYTRKECAYSELKGVHITGLKELRKSPKHYQHRLNHPRKTTNSLGFGNAVHVAVLEPERFIRDFALWHGKHPEGGTRPRNGKAWDEFKLLNSGRTIIRDEEYDEAIAFKDAVRQDPVAMKYLATGRAEVAMTWTDNETGIECVGRVDWETKVDKHPAVVDLKSARDCGETWFTRDAAKLDYHLQLAFYADGYKSITGKQPRMVVVAVESAPPYDVVTYIVPEEVLEVGRDAYHELLVKFKACTDSGEWPGQGGSEEKILSLPAWAVPEEESDDMADLDWSKAG